jgi:hypothetical protein
MKKQTRLSKMDWKLSYKWIPIAVIVVVASLVFFFVKLFWDVKAY